VANVRMSATARTGGGARRSQTQVRRTSMNGNWGFGTICMKIEPTFASSAPDGPLPDATAT
jgi:hypothetical protein